jgi:hypothetical protein
MRLRLLCLENQTNVFASENSIPTAFLETDVKIRLMENFRAIFYAPYYATHTLGFYANEGI